MNAYGRSRFMADGAWSACDLIAEEGKVRMENCFFASDRDKISRENRDSHLTIMRVYDIIKRKMYFFYI